MWIFAAVASVLRPGGTLVINVVETRNEDGETPLATDVSERVARHLVPRASLGIAWDVAPAGIAGDRCLVFEKVVAPG